MSTFERFADKIEDIANNLSDDLQEILAHTTGAVHERVIKDTPVKTGNACVNWQVGTTVNSTLQNKPENVIDGMTKAIERGRKELETRSNIYYIFNNVDYIGRLNRGYSRQAPSYFVQRSILQVIHNVVTTSFSYTIGARIGGYRANDR